MDAGIAVEGAPIVDEAVAVVVDAIAELGARPRLNNWTVDVRAIDAGEPTRDSTRTEPSLARHAEERRPGAGAAGNRGDVAVAVLVHEVSRNLHRREDLSHADGRPSGGAIAGARSGVAGADTEGGRRSRVATQRIQIIDQSVAVVVETVADLRRRRDDPGGITVPETSRGTEEVTGPGALPRPVHARLADATAVRTGARVDRRDGPIGRNRGVDGRCRVLNARVDRWRRVALGRIVDAVPSVRHAGVVRPRALRAAATDDSARADLPDDRPHRRAVHRIEGRVVERAAGVDDENDHETKKAVTCHLNPPA